MDDFLLLSGGSIVMIPVGGLYSDESFEKYIHRNPIIHNPNNKKIQQLPVILGFNSADKRFKTMVIGKVISEDNVIISTHVSTNESYLLQDLDLVKHNFGNKYNLGKYINIYPDGFRIEFISYPDVFKSERLKDFL